MGKFTHRVGGEAIPRFGGVRQECDPGAIPPNMFRNAVNVRYKGGRLVSRGGQSKFNASALSGRVQGIFSSEFEFSTAVPADSCAEVGVGGGTEIGSQKLFLTGQDSTYGFFYFGEDQRPVLRRQPYDIVRTIDCEMAAFGDGSIWVGGYDETQMYLKRFQRGGAPAILATVARVAPAETSLFGFGDIERCAGVIYFSTGSYIPENARVYRYSANAIVQADAPFVVGEPGGRPHLVAVGSMLYMVRGRDLGATKIRRKAGGSDSWVTMTPSIANFTCCGQPAVYEGSVYAFGWAGSSAANLCPVAIKIVDTTVSTVRDLTGAANYRDYFCRPTVFNGYLYYMYMDRNSSTGLYEGMYVGRFDGTTWNDTHKNVTSLYGGSASPIQDDNFFGAFDGKLRLIIGGRWTDGACTGMVWSSPGVDTAGTWTQHAANHRRQQDSLSVFSDVPYGFSRSGAVM